MWTMEGAINKLVTEGLFTFLDTVAKKSIDKCNILRHDNWILSREYSLLVSGVGKVEL